MAVRDTIIKQKDHFILDSNHTAVPYTLTTHFLGEKFDMRTNEYSEGMINL
jgi:hypothetical protein